MLHIFNISFARLTMPAVIASFVLILLTPPRIQPVLALVIQPDTPEDGCFFATLSHLYIPLHSCCIREVLAPIHDDIKPSYLGKRLAPHSACKTSFSVSSRCQLHPMCMTKQQTSCSTDARCKSCDYRPICGHVHSHKRARLHCTYSPQDRFVSCWGEVLLSTTDGTGTLTRYSMAFEYN